jgi:hypothetical protein
VNDEEKRTLVVQLKDEAEVAVKKFKSCVDQINAAGYLVKVQADNTLYVFRDVRESYGTLIQAPPNVIKEPINE